MTPAYKPEAFSILTNHFIGRKIDSLFDLPKHESELLAVMQTVYTYISIVVII